MKKKVKIKYKNIFCLLIVIALIVFGISHFNNKDNTSDIDNKNTNTNTNINENNNSNNENEVNNNSDTNNKSNENETNNKNEKPEEEVNQPITEKTYYTEVIRNKNTVIVYKMDNNGEYTKIVKVFPCSVGKDDGTPTGTFKTTDKYVWRALFGGVYGQYATRINGSILFHSVPYTAQRKDSLEWDEYNKLGSAASMGCVRMTVEDVKWIYDNCPSGMTVKIYDGELPSGIEKPTAPKIDVNSPNKGWDPTDPDSNNPWKK